MLFGSRARGDYRENSDVDLCVVRKHCDEDLWNRLLASVKTTPTLS
jgi:predicted nucleotidyltransferase